jgi:hypothetical protein
MHTTNVRQIKAALVEQAFHGTTQVRCPWGQVVAVSRWKGQLRVMIRGWPRWYPVESVRIEHLCVGRQPPETTSSGERVKNVHNARQEQLSRD